MHLPWTLITICIVVGLLFVYSCVFLISACCSSGWVLYSFGLVVETFFLIWLCISMFFVVGSYDLELDIDPFYFVTITHCMLKYIRLSWRFRRFFGVLCWSQLPKEMLLHVRYYTTSIFRNFCITSEICFLTFILALTFHTIFRSGFKIFLPTFGPLSLWVGE
jgi:hypothetical protein